MTRSSAIDRRALLGIGGATVVAVVWWNPIAPAHAERRFAVARSPAEWRRRLGPERFAILRQAGTERPGSSPLNHEKRKGVFGCAGCGLPLFASAAKYNSGTGWPSFTQALADSVVTRSDSRLLMKRIEVLCRRCGGHLGHLFSDGPKPTGRRYCINGLALRFTPA